MSTNRLDDLLGGAGDKGSRPGDAWDDPVSLGRRPGPLPVDALGDLAPFVRAVAASYQVPTCLVITYVLPTITAAVRGRRIVRVNSDWIEIIAVATLAILPSGERKSPVQAVVVTPLRQHQTTAQMDAAPRIAEQRAKRKLAEDRAENLRKAAVKFVPGIEQIKADDAYIRAVQELDALAVDPPPRWLLDDVTPEKMVRVLAEHGGVGAISDEPTLFSIWAGKYNGGTANVEVMLKACSGSAITVDRVNLDEPVHVDRPALSISMAIQPGRLSELGRTVEFRASGALARLLFALPDPRVGTRSTTSPRVPQHILDGWSARITKLAAADVDSDLGVDPGALRRLNEFRDELEPTLHPAHGSLAGIADWGSKLPGAIVRIAAALQLLDDPCAEVIAEVTMTNAIKLGRAYISHAIAAFGLIHAKDDTLSHAREVLGWLKTHVPGLHAQKSQNAGSNGQNPSSVTSVHALGEFTLRDVMLGLRGRSWVEDADDIRAPLKVLTERGHVRRLANPPGQTGRPSERYQLHPQHLTGEPQFEPAPAPAPEPTTSSVAPSGLPVWED